MKFRIAIPLVAALVLGSAGAANADAFKPSKNDQVKLGKQAAAQIRKEERVLPSSDSRVRLLRRVGQRLIAELPEENDPWEYSFDVIEDKQINAFALPGGPVFFNTGLLDILETEDQLAGVLAHEMTHVEREHWAYAYADQQKRQLGLSLLLIFTRANRTVGDLASITNDVLLSLPFSRNAETQSDEQGMDLMVRAGYNPNGMPDVFRLMSAAQKGGAPPEFLSTHPSDKTRISRLEQRAGKMKGNFREQRQLPWR